MRASHQSCLTGFCRGNAPSSPCLAVCVCVHVGVRVRGLQALPDPEMRPGSQKETPPPQLPLAGQRSFYALICKQGRSIWPLAGQGLCAGVGAAAVLDVTQGGGAPAGTMTRRTAAHRRLNYLTFISVREVARCSGSCPPPL